MNKKIILLIVSINIFLHTNIYPMKKTSECPQWIRDKLIFADDMDVESKREKEKREQEKKKLKFSPLLSLYNNSLLAGFLSGNAIALLLKAKNGRHIFLYTTLLGAAFSSLYRWTSHKALYNNDIKHKRKLNVLRSLYKKEITSYCMLGCARKK